MKSLIIYDNTGYVYSQMEGCYVQPQGGVQYLEVEIPEGKILREIDVTITPNVPIFIDMPLNETDLLKKRIEEQESAILELASLIGGTV
jgi:hypothetical protein